jgi:hypothetical protein
MFALIVSCSSLNLTQILCGDWNVSAVDLDSDGRKFPPSFFTCQLHLTSPLPGHLTGTFSPSVLPPLNLTESSHSNATFMFQISPKVLEEIALHFDGPASATAIGQTASGTLYSANLLSPRALKLSIFNSTTKTVRLFRFEKFYRSDDRLAFFLSLSLFGVATIIFFVTICHK